MIDYETAKELRETDSFDRRNVADRFKGWPDESIKKELTKTSSELHIIASNNIRDLNWGSVVRSVNSFNVEGITFVGRKQYDRRGAVGAHNYTNVYYDEQDMVSVIRRFIHHGYYVIAAEYDEEFFMTSLDDYEWTDRPAIVLGEEGLSLSKEVLNAVHEVVYIPMYGSVRSLNLASAASIFMYDYNKKMGRK